LLVNMTGAVMGVIGGSGGVGASSFAAALALAAGQAMLLDCDASGGGIDVLLGIESVPGARWSGLRLDGGWLDPALLDEGLPRWREVGVLAADVAPPSPDAVRQVVGAATERGVVVLDLPRVPGPLRDVALYCCDLCVLVAAAEVRPLAAARAIRPAGPVPVGVVMRRGSVPAVEAVRMLGGLLLGILPALSSRSGDTPGRVPRAVLRVAGGVWDGLAAAVPAGLDAEIGDVA
jgi:hypothetical protein